jgi:energy-coupling factor transporter ATP-binding protein EcfA2
MKLTRFRIQRYKCILDSGWIAAPSLTVLIGKNESGKTSLLKALHKFNPARPEPYSITREWPRGYRGERSEAQVVCRAEFQLTPEELQQLQTLAGKPIALEQIEVTRDYAGRFDVRFPAGLFPEDPGHGAQSPARDFVLQHLPVFVYMDECQSFSGTARLDVVKRRKEHGDLQPADDTFLTILALAELDFEHQFQQGGETDEAAREERQYDVSDGEATLNRKIAGHWGQMRYQVQLRTDGYQFMTFVKSLDDQALIRLEDRSKGFQWFFSFDLMLMHQTRGKLKNCVILLDEPGIHLHPEGQQDLLQRLSEYARDSVLIYTTHQPFMIDLAAPDRLRIVSESPQGTVVSEALAQSPTAAKLVLQAALGIAGRTSWLLADQNLVVGGADEYWILMELSNLFRRLGREGLPPEVLVTAAGGAPAATYLSTFMVGQDLEVVALFANDAAGRAARENLASNWLPKYGDRKATALDLATAVGRPSQELAMEDLFPERFYVERVQRAYDKEISAYSISLAPLPSGSLLAKRVEGAFTAAGIPFDRQRVGRRIASEIRQMKTLSDLPEQTRLLAEHLFGALARIFSKG